MKYRIEIVRAHVPHALGILTEKGRILQETETTFLTDQGVFGKADYPTVSIRLVGKEKTIVASPSLDDLLHRVGQYIDESEFCITSVCWQDLAIIKLHK